MSKLIALLFFLFSCCVGNAFSQSQEAAIGDVAALCDRIAEIERLPHTDESGVDPVYDALVEAGEAVVPCLIEKIVDTEIMSDPRCPGISRETKVGDVAYFVLVDITKIDFMELFPSDVQDKYKTRGVYAYHDYIEVEGKRKELQTKLREWFEKKQTARK